MTIGPKLKRTPEHRLRQRFAASAAALSVAGLIFAGAAPATAAPQVSADFIYLATAPSWSTYATGGVIGDSPVAITNGQPGGWYVQPEGTSSGNGISGNAYEFYAVLTSGKLSDWCIGGTSTYPAELLACGANGTVWVAVPNGDGYLLYNRYQLNRGTDAVLAAYSPFSNGADLYIEPTNGIPSQFYIRWLDSYGVIT
jgi:hypothetical protein